MFGYVKRISGVCHNCWKKMVITVAEINAQLN